MKKTTKATKSTSVKKEKRIHTKKEIEEFVSMLQMNLSNCIQKKTILENQLTVLCSQYEECVATYGDEDQMCIDLLTLKTYTEEQLEAECNFIDTVLEPMVNEWASQIENAPH